MTGYKRPRYVHAYIDRHGRSRIYFNKPGIPKVALRGPLGSKVFWEDYHEAEKGALDHKADIGAARTLPGSLNHLIVRYYQAPEYLSLAGSTQKVVRRILDNFRRERGDRAVKGLERGHVKTILGKMADRPGAANSLLKRLKVLTRFAVDVGMIKIDPLAGMRGFKYEVQSHHAWADDEIARFEERHPAGTKAHLALTLMLYTGQRRSDAVKMGWHHVKGDRIAVKQQKTKAFLEIPIHPKLQAAIDLLPRNNPTFLMTEQGKSFTSNGFGNWMRDRCDEAALPDCSAHGLRGSMATRLTEAGCTDPEVMAITGHKTASQLTVYTKTANQKLLSGKAMQALQEAEKGTNPANSNQKVSKTGG